MPLIPSTDIASFMVSMHVARHKKLSSLHPFTHLLGDQIAILAGVVGVYTASDKCPAPK